MHEQTVNGLADAVVKKLEKKGQPHLFNEQEMIKTGLFAAISFKRKRLFDLDVVCNLLVRKVKEMDEISLKHAANQVANGITPPQSDQTVAHTYKPNEGEVPDLVDTEVQTPTE
ncbi:hypothetical protein LWI28_022739 [Acer negundo]|uniref:Uncharacterized protein n=1 Tax=Acer negundo TaxID=4023 RepID=A0AAD5J7I2_ACENE|nr:hypothetical protein LWI28_022739 [Acer negundo]